MHVNNEGRVGEPFTDFALFVIVVDCKFKVALMKIEDLYHADAVVVVIVGNQRVTIVLFTDFGNHSAWYNFVADIFERDLGNQFLHEARVRLWCKDCWGFSFNSVGVTVFDVAEVYEDLGKFR